MKLDAKAFWRRRRPALWGVLAALAILAVLGGLWLATGEGPGEGHVAVARVKTVAGGSFAAPAHVLDLPAVNAGEWASAALPYALPRGARDKASAEVKTVTWLQVSLANLTPSSGGTVLYVPRWQAKGQIAVYGDEKLVYRSRGDPLWNGFNHPLWVALDTEGTQPLPKVLYLRIDSLASASGAVSSLWVGSAEALLPRYQWRRWLQTGVTQAMSIIVLGLSAYAFAVWLMRRRERVYLYFSLFAFVWVLRSLHFHVGNEPLPIPPAWFGWMTITSSNALLLTWYFFVGTLVPGLPRWLGRGLLTLLTLSAIVTLPPLAVYPRIDAFAPLAYLVTISTGIPAGFVLAWFAWKHGGREGILATSVGLVHVPVALHDWLLHSSLISPEGYYFWPISTIARLLLFIYIILSRYTGAVDEVEQANQRLEQRLREREDELAVTYERMRRIEQRETLTQERQRLMQDIHDGMGSQLMTALKVAESGALTEAQVAQVLRECIDDLKLTVDSLEPVDADLLLLLAALRFRLAPRLEGSGLRLRWEVSDVPALSWLDPRSSLHVLRIVQEAFTNVIKHAGASEVRVSTGRECEGVFVQLVDNGAGFDALMSTAGRGLRNMQRRARAVGGAVSWSTDPSGGTRFRLWLPLQQPAPATAQPPLAAPMPT